MIEPTVGRIVHYRIPEAGYAPPRIFPAIITAVHDDRCVNLHVFGAHPSGQLLTSVRLAQPGDERDPSIPYCEWMPYQVKKDYGSESGEKAAGTESI